MTLTCWAKQSKQDKQRDQTSHLYQLQGQKHIHQLKLNYTLQLFQLLQNNMMHKISNTSHTQMYVCALINTEWEANPKL